MSARRPNHRSARSGSPGGLPGPLRIAAAVLTATAALLSAGPVRAEERVVLLKSASATGAIGPYEEAARGFRERRAPALEATITTRPDPSTIEAVRRAQPGVLVTIGSEAARFAKDHFPDVARVVALAPDSGPESAPAPVVTLASAVPASVQLRWIAEVLPDVERVGVVFDPRTGQAAIDDLVAAAAAKFPGRKRGLKIVPIPVGGEGEVPSAFRKAKPRIQALLFVPDATVITKGTIGYLLKESLAAAIPAIGFNWYFVDNGAVMAFGVDYAQTGRQAAEAARRLEVERLGFVEPPAKVTVWVNHRVAQKLRIRTDYDPDQVQEIR